MTNKNDTDFKTSQKLDWLKNRLSTGVGFTLAELMQEFDVSESSAKRYIAMLRKDFGLELIIQNRRYLLKTEIPIKTENLEDSQFQLFYAFIKKLGEDKVFSPLVTNLWLERMNEKLPARINELSDKITYLFSESEANRPTIIKEIFKSFTAKRVLLITYQMPGKKPFQNKLIPWQLVNYQGKWYLVAYNISQDYTNYYRIQRIKDISITTDSFEEPEINTVRNFVNNAFGLGGGNEIKIARIKFYPPVAHSIDELVWHSEQEISEENECKIMKLPYSFGSELIGRVLRYGQYAEILEPEELRVEWQSKIREMSKRFLQD